MNITLFPSELKGHVNASASKSSMQRACAAALVAAKKSVLHNPGHSSDDKAAMRIIQVLGATVSNNNENVIINSTGFRAAAEVLNEETGTEETVHCGESGLSIRMFTPLAALSGKKMIITGEGSLLQRPMHFFDEVLPQLGVTIKSNEGKLPLMIQGPLQPKDITIDGSLSSQFLTGLLLAFSVAPCKKDTVSIRVNHLKSKPYIDLTLDVMKKFGLNVPQNNNYEEFVFKYDSLNVPSEKENLEVNYTVEGDWSGGAVLLVAGAIAGNISVRGLSMTSTQADKKITEALMEAHAGMAIEAKGIRMHKTEMQAFHFDATDCPDLFPPLVVLAAYSKGVSQIKGVNRLAHKESDRGLTLQQEFAKMNVPIDFQDDIMYIHGGNGLKGATVHSRYDHRIAMACAAAALSAEGSTTIVEAQAVNKSYPDFYDHLKSLGAKIRGGIDMQQIKSLIQ